MLDLAGDVDAVIVMIDPVDQQLELTAPADIRTDLAQLQNVVRRSASHASIFLSRDGPIGNTSVPNVPGMCPD
jgi:hypothetical protein